MTQRINGRVVLALAAHTAIVLWAIAIGAPTSKDSVASSNGETVLRGRVTDESGMPLAISFLLQPAIDRFEFKKWGTRTEDDFDATQVVTTADDGTFEVRGLPSPWRGWIGIGAYAEFTSASWIGSAIAFPTAMIPLSLPAAELRMTVRRFPMLCARVLPASDTEQYSGWALSARTTGGGDISIIRGSVAVGKDFQYPAGPIPLSSVSIDFWSGKNEQTAKHFDIDGPIVRNVDLGEVTLHPARRVAIRVVEASGSPITDAVITLPGPLGATSPPRTAKVDAQGSASFKLRGGQCTLFIQANGYRRKAVIVPESAPDPIVVTLDRCTSLTARVKMSNGQPPSSIVLRVRADDGKKPLSSADDQIPISDDNNTWDEEGSVAKHSSAGIVRFCGLPPHRRLVLEVHQRDVARLFTMPIMLNDGEWRDVTCELAHVERNVTGFVRTIDGAPLEDAIVEFNGWSRVTHADGRFTIEGSLVRTGTLEILRSGYVPLRREDFVFPDDGADIEFRLDRESPLMVHVADAVGHPFVLPQYIAGDDPAVWVEIPSKRGAVHRPRPRRRWGRPSELDLRPDVYVFDGLPDGDVIIKWMDAARRTYEHRNVAKKPEIHVAVPLHGELLIAIGVALSEGHEYRVVLRPSEAPERSIVQSNIFPGPFGPKRSWYDRTCEFEQLTEGSYTAALERRDEFSSESGTITHWTEVSKPTSVRVRAGALASLLLETKN